MHKLRLDSSNSGMIAFVDARSDLVAGGFLQTRAFCPKRKMRPEAGEIVIFPSHLGRLVYPNRSWGDPATIAPDVALRKGQSTEVEGSGEGD